MLNVELWRPGVTVNPDEAGGRRDYAPNCLPCLRLIVSVVYLIPLPL